MLVLRCVVNCAGAWAGYIAGMVGLKIPLIAMRHAYVTTDRIDGVQNKPNVRDHDASVYIKLQVEFIFNNDSAAR